MKDKVFSVLQRVGRSFMLPIAILPVAGLLLGIGSSFTNATTISTYHLESILGDGTLLNALLIIMSKAGNVIFDNLPLIFAVGVAIGMAKEEKEVSALSRPHSLFRDARLHQRRAHCQRKGTGGRNGGGRRTGRNHCQCVRNADPQMGVFGGILVGLGVAALHNRFHKIVLPNALSFFGGSRFVPIISTVVYLFVGNRHVLCVAGGSECNLFPGRPGDGNGLCGDSDFRYCEAGADSLWTSSRILSAFLADGCGRHHDGGRTADPGRTEYFLCPAGVSGCGSFQRGRHQIFLR